MEYGEYYFFNNFNQNETYITSSNDSYISTLKLTQGKDEDAFKRFISAMLTNPDWANSLGSATGAISADISKIDEDNYEMIVKYNVEDFTSGIGELKDYNEDKDGNFIEYTEVVIKDEFARFKEIAPFHDSLTTRYHYTGLAKDHKVKGEIQIAVKWKRGERLTGYKNKIDAKVTVEY